MLKLKTAPTIEPISLAEAKLHLRLDSGTLAGDLTTVQTIAPGSHGVAAAYSLVGTAVTVLGYDVLVNLVSGANGASGTVDVKLQDSDDNATWADVTDGAFTQVTGSNDEAVQELAYQGGKTYLRAVATVAVAACSFGVDIVMKGASSVEDTLLTRLIETARKYCEAFQRRSYINQTWYLWLDTWPDGDLTIPLPPLVSVAGITYYDTANTVATMSASDYFVDAISEPGRISLAYGKTWPSVSLRPVNAVCVEFTAGYGSAASSVPKPVTQAMLLLIAHWYENREAVILGLNQARTQFAVDALLWPDRVL